MHTIVKLLAQIIDQEINNFTTLQHEGGNENLIEQSLDHLGLFGGSFKLLRLLFLQYHEKLTAGLGCCRIEEEYIHTFFHTSVRFRKLITILISYPDQFLCHLAKTVRKINYQPFLVLETLFVHVSCLLRRIGSQYCRLLLENPWFHWHLYLSIATDAE